MCSSTISRTTMILEEISSIEIVQASFRYVIIDLSFISCIRSWSERSTLLGTGFWIANRRLIHRKLRSSVELQLGQQVRDTNRTTRLQIIREHQSGYQNEAVSIKPRYARDLDEAPGPDNASSSLNRCQLGHELILGPYKPDAQIIHPILALHAKSKIEIPNHLGKGDSHFSKLKENN